MGDYGDQLYKSDYVKTNFHVNDDVSQEEFRQKEDKSYNALGQKNNDQILEELDQYESISKKITVNEGLTPDEKLRVEAKKAGKIKHASPPGYGEKKDRRSAAKSADKNIQAAKKSYKENMNLKETLEFIRLSGHAECEAIKAQGYSEKSPEYMRARARLLRRRIAAIEGNPEEMDSYKSLLSSAKKELDKLTEKLYTAEKKKEHDMRKEQTKLVVSELNQPKSDFVTYRVSEAGRDWSDSVHYYLDYIMDLVDKNDVSKDKFEILQSIVSFLEPIHFDMADSRNRQYEVSERDYARNKRNKDFINSVMEDDKEALEAEMVKNFEKIINYKIPFGEDARAEELSSMVREMFYMRGIFNTLFGSGKFFKTPMLQDFCKKYNITDEFIDFLCNDYLVFANRYFDTNLICSAGVHFFHMNQYDYLDELGYKQYENDYEDSKKAYEEDLQTTKEKVEEFHKKAEAGHEGAKMCLEIFDVGKHMTLRDFVARFNESRDKSPIMWRKN